jgi:LysM repeat protein
MTFLAILLAFSVSSSYTDEFHIHQVARGETLYVIAEHYYNDGDKWEDIRDINGLDDHNIDVGQKLYIPKANSKISYWKKCLSAGKKRLAQKKITDRHKHLLVEKIARMSQTLPSEYNQIQKMRLCLAAITTAEQESMYEFAIGPVGELGPFQFRASTVRYISEKYFHGSKELTDRDVTNMMLQDRVAIKYFFLYFTELYKRHGTLELAWMRYNGKGPAAAEYSIKAIKRYKSIRKLIKTLR